jgi:[methyl-Co(III) methanol-specific corrinoid protein]:coenzyme M methyltransferase
LGKVGGFEMIPRERVVKLFRKEPIDRMPIFSGQGMVVLPAIEACGLHFSEIHLSEESMANTAIQTAEMFAFDGIVVPYDMCTIPEAMGLKASLYEDSQEILYPTIPYKWKTPEEVAIPEDIFQRRRMPVVSKAIQLIKEKVGDRLSLGSWTLGPFTLAGQVVELDILMKMTLKERIRVEGLLDRLADLIIRIGNFYYDLGVDYMSLREMGAGTDILSPRVFKSIIQPRLIRILQAWKSPKVLHICGATDLIIEMMNECGADAISVDQKNHVEQTRRKLGDRILLFGNFDPYNTLCVTEPGRVEEIIKGCIDAGVDAVWPGCDIWPAVKEENLKAYIDTIIKYGKNPTPAVGRC